MSKEMVKCSQCGSNVLLVGDNLKSYTPLSVYLEVPRDIIYRVYNNALEQPIVPKDKKLIHISNGSVKDIEELEIATPEEVADILDVIPKQEEATNVQEKHPKKQDIDDLLNTESTEIPETQALNETLSIEKNIIDSNKK